MVAYILARKEGGRVLMRIEDLDTQRTKQEYANAIFRDLETLGFEWENEPVYQSQRTEAYIAALEKLKQQKLIYSCFCSRADLHSANAPHFGEEYVYAGTCSNLTPSEQAKRAIKRNPSTRIRVNSNAIEFTDRFQGAHCYNLEKCSGDFIIRRSDKVFAYQLAVVVDDAAMGVNSVVRGVDLITSTPRQIYLQELLGLEHPSYGHVPLIVDDSGKRLAKRDNACDVSALMRDKRITPQRLLGHLAFCAGIIEEDLSTSLEELIKYANLDALCKKQSFKVSLFKSKI
jgi:glutamyl-queuosine tRNA(Asp) synthetase